MRTFLNSFSPSKLKKQTKLPNALKIYETADFAIQQKAKFIYYMIYAVLIGVIFVLATSTYFQLLMNGNKGVYLPALLPSFSLLFVIVACLILLVKGFYGITTHLIMIFSILSVWLAMWFDNSPILGKLDTVVIIIGLLFLAPLFITKFKTTIVIYIVSNILILIGFMWYWGDKLSIANFDTLEYLIDNIIAFVFIGVVGYNIFAINKKTVDRAQVEINERKLTEESLKESESFRQRVFDSSRISIVIMDAITLKYVDLNQAAVDIYRFQSREFALGKTPNDVSAPFQYDGTPSVQKALNYIERALKEGSVVFEWKHQRPDGEIWDAEVHLMSFQSGEKNLLQFSMVDITERKRVEKALEESQRLFQALAQMSPVGIFRTRADGYTTYVNPKWSELSGLPFEEALGDGWLKAVHQEDRVLLAENWKMHSSKGEKSMTEYRFVKPDGSTVWVLGDTNPEIVDDEIKGYIGTLTNITELKLAENAIKESEERFKTLSTIASEGIMIHESGIIIDLNQTFANILGYSNEKDLIGKIGLETIPFTPESKQIVKKHFLSKSEETLDIEIVNSKGTIIPIETRGVEIVYKGRKANLVYIRDITERKQAEKALIESEERHRKLIEALPEMIMQTDLNGKILYGNEPLEQITGITQKDYNNPNRLAHIHPEDQKKVKDALMDFLNSNTIHSDVIENRFIDTWGNLHWFSGRWTKLNLNDQVVIQTVTRDITENKKNELELNNYRNHLELLVQERTDELATTNEELRSTNEELFDQREELQNSIDKLHEAQQQLIHAEKMASLGVLSAGIAHEINNPLNFIHGGIVGLEDYINDNLPEHSLKVEPLLNAVNIGVKRATAIVTSLSHYSRKEDLPPTDCDIHEIIDNSLIMLQNKLKNKVEIKKHYTSDNCVIFGSEGKLHQAFLNIISNAEQAITSKGTIEINTKIKQKNLIISITDSGSGINPENIQKIFDPFFTTKDPGKGTGLGMAITYNIIKEHQGTIEYDSNIGLGTTVIITLPITKKIKN